MNNPWGSKCAPKEREREREEGREGGRERGRGRERERERERMYASHTGISGVSTN